MVNYKSYYTRYNKTVIAVLIQSRCKCVCTICFHNIYWQHIPLIGYSDTEVIISRMLIEMLSFLFPTSVSYYNSFALIELLNIAQHKYE